LDSLEEEKAQIVEQISDNVKTANFASINKRLHEIQIEIDSLSNDWEVTATALDTALKKHAKEIQSLEI